MSLFSKLQLCKDFDTEWLFSYQLQIENPLFGKLKGRVCQKIRKLVDHMTIYRDICKCQAVFDCGLSGFLAGFAKITSWNESGVECSRYIFYPILLLWQNGWFGRKWENPGESMMVGWSGNPRAEPRSADARDNTLPLPLCQPCHHLSFSGNTLPDTFVLMVTCTPISKPSSNCGDNPL